MKQARPRAPETPDPARQLARREWAVVAILTLLAAILRLQAFGKLGLTHFDEGVYALAGLWSVTGEGIGPDLIAYAPPGFPFLIGLAYQVFGVSDASTLIVSILAGVLSVPVAAWLAQATFGRGAGAVAATLAALSLAHLAFSRKALTDASFLLFWLLAIGQGARFLERPGFARAILLGLAVGVCQNFKYHGWLAGAVTVLAAVTGLLSDSHLRTRSTLSRTFGWGLVAIAVVGLVYLPWFRLIEANGGYADLLRHQRGYFLGVAAWPSGLHQQLGQVVALSGGPYWALLTATIVCASLIVLPLAPDLKGPLLPRLLLVGFGATILLVVPSYGWWVGLALVPWLLRDPRPSRRILGAWWLSQSVLTPLYLPYARLWLPLHAAGWIVMAGLLVSIGPALENGFVPPIALKTWIKDRPAFLKSVFAAVILMVGFATERSLGARPMPVSEFFKPTDGLRNLVAIVTTTSPPEYQPLQSLRVLCRRPVAFYLALQGKMPFRLMAGGEGEDLTPTSATEGMLIDLGLDPVTLVGASRERRSGRAWGEGPALPEVPLDPVTRLDIRPDSAYRLDELPTTFLLLRPKPSGLR